jgi:hypothetical protein
MGKRNRGDVPPLTQFWTPPAHIGPGGAGEPRACLATTFEFEASFFESELLPRFLGLRYDQTEVEPVFVAEREEALESVQASVLVDISRFDPGQTTLRWDQLPVQVSDGIQHAKVTVLAWERCVRVIIGSANLTRPGYRRNRELFAALDFWDNSDSVPLGLLKDVVRWFKVTAAWVRAVPQARERLLAGLDGVLGLVRGWRHAPEEFSPRQRPQVRLLATFPRQAGGARGSRSALDEILKFWGDRRAHRITVVTPFVGQVQGEQDPVINRLMSIPRSQDCEGWLVVPQSASPPDDPQIRVPIPQQFCRAWADAFLGRREAFILPIPLAVQGVEERNRDLHSKAVLIEGESDTLLCLGSSNFTPHGMGVGAFNLEANVAFLDRGTERRHGLTLIDRLGLPFPQDRDHGFPADQVVGEAAVISPESDVGTTSALPWFFAWAAYSQLDGRLRVELDLSQPKPAFWSISLPSGPTEDGLGLFRSTNLPRPIEGPLIHQVPLSSRAINLTALRVEWSDTGEDLNSGYLPVSVESADHLLPPDAFRALGPDAIIECLISGKSPSEWLAAKSQATRSPQKGTKLLDSLRAVEASGYLLYRIRRFGRALAGLSERLARTSPTPDALRYRLLRDPFGPVSLARAIGHVGPGDPGAGFGSLEGEHRAYLVGELLLSLWFVRQRYLDERKPELKLLRPDERAKVRGCFDEALTAIADLLGHTPGTLPKNLDDYLRRIYHEVDVPYPVTNGVDHDARELALRDGGDQPARDREPEDPEAGRGAAGDDRPGDPQGVRAAAGGDAG